MPDRKSCTGPTIWRLSSVHYYTDWSVSSDVFVWWFVSLTRNDCHILILNRSCSYSIITSANNVNVYWPVCRFLAVFVVVRVSRAAYFDLLLLSMTLTAFEVIVPKAKNKQTKKLLPHYAARLVDMNSCGNFTTLSFKL